MDFLDPNNWDELLRDDHEYRIYLDDTGELYALVDREDYEWASQNKWCAKKDPTGKIYARRAISENANGQRLRTWTMYLHIEIMKRTKKRRKSPAHVLVDHRNGKSLDCRRFNLRHATSQQNNLNRYGRAAIQVSMAL